MPINIENLTFKYESSAGVAQHAIENVTLTINDNETLCIIGHTGSGKSTLVQHINGLLQPTGGSIEINGINLNNKQKRYEIRKNVGMVFQYPEYQLFEETVEKDIAFGPKNLGVAQDDILDHVKKAMDIVKLDYDKYAKRSPFELSGGEKRRVALAGVLATDPATVILDEPMAGLDPIGKSQMIKLILELKQSKTIIMISHNMDDVAMLADRVAVLNKGSLLLIGTPLEVFSQDELLQSINLDIPTAAGFAKKLRDNNINVPKDIITFEQLVDFLGERLCLTV